MFYWDLVVPPGEDVANRRRSTEELREIDGIVERLCEFLRLNYMTGATWLDEWA
jgi:hypothetical protein